MNNIFNNGIKIRFFYGKKTIFIEMKADQVKLNFWNNFPELSIQNGAVPTQVVGKTYS